MLLNKKISSDVCLIRERPVCNIAGALFYAISYKIIRMNPHAHYLQDYHANRFEPATHKMTPTVIPSIAILTGS